MPIVVPRGSNARAIDLLQSVSFDWIFPNVGRKAQEQLMAHLQWMRYQRDDLEVRCRFETEGRSTRIILEARFKGQSS